MIFKITFERLKTILRNFDLITFNKGVQNFKKNNSFIKV